MAEQRGEQKLAVTFYKKSVELDPKFENGYFNLAAAYANLKQFENARESLKTLIKLNPNDQDAIEMLRRVESDIKNESKRVPKKK